jgi:homoaconitase/3-isopropylmalate dehydratase large subunit
MAQPRTLFGKIWDSHVIAPAGEGTYLLYIDLHLAHEVTTPQAFDGLKLAGRKVPPGSTIPNRSFRSTRSNATLSNSACPISRSTASTKALSTSSDPSRVSRSRA